MEELELIKSAMKMAGLEKEVETLTFGDAVILHQRINRAVKYFYEQKNNPDEKQTQESEPQEEQPQGQPKK